MFDAVQLQANSLDAFLDFLYDGLTGYVIVAELHNMNGQPRMQRHPYHWPTQKEAFREHIRRAGPNVNTYIPPAVFSQPLAKKEYFLASNVAWVEFDGGTDDGRRFGGHKPSLRICSSVPGREHWYYRMVTPVDSITELERYNKALAYTLGGDTGGWDAVQLLRPIGSPNHKYEGRPIVHVLNVFPDNEWPKGELDAGWTDPSEQPVTLAEAPLVLPDIKDVKRREWPEKAWDLLHWPSCPPGTRSDSLMALGYYTAEMGLSDEEMLAVLVYADDKWGKFKNRPDRIKRLVEIIKIARQKYPRTTEPTNTLDKLVAANVLGGWVDILNADVNFDWIIENFWLRDTNLVLAGEQNVGKTQLSMRFGMNIALGRDEFIGYKIKSQHKMLFLSLELGIVPMKLLTKAMSPNLSADEKRHLQENFIIAAMGEAMPLHTDVGQAQLVKILNAVEPEGLIIDSIGKTITRPSDEEQAIASSNFLNKLNNQGLMVWGIHHLRKTGQGERRKSPILDDAYGNQYLTAFARAAYGLSDSDSGLELIQLKNNFAARPGYSLQLQRTPDLNFDKVGEISDEEKAEKEQAGSFSKLFGEK